jgi:chaperonin GroES
MNLKAIGDHIIVRRDAAKEKSEGGIIIPDSAQEKQSQGVIISVGPGRRNDNGELIAMNVAENDRVLFRHYGNEEIEIDGEKLCFMREGDVLAIL